MSWFNRRSLLLTPLALTACGFEPVYGPSGTGTRLQGKVGFNDPTSRDMYQMVQQLERRLGRSVKPTYQLELNLQLGEDGLGLDAEGNTTRQQYVGAISFVLRDAATNTELYAGHTRNFTGYSTTGNTVATNAAQQDARRRLMVILADQIVQDLLLADLPA